MLRAFLWRKMLGKYSRSYLINLQGDYSNSAEHQCNWLSLGFALIDLFSANSGL